jgi:DNA (cytosine-5)-methyltransferase 1
VNTVINYKLLNAVDYSVPQKRERVIIVGVRRDIIKEYEFPKPCGKRLVLRDVLMGCPVSKGYKYPEKKKEIMQLVPPGGCWVDLPENIRKEYMGNSLKSGGGKRGVARRLSMDEPSLTLTTSPCQKQTERCHPIETRPLTVREYARIQTFPDTFVFCGSIAQQYKQIGNAVPVKLAYHLARSIETVLRT